MKKLYNPLVLFIVFGLIAYLVYIKVKPNHKDSIIITNQIIEALINNDQALTQATITEERKQSLIANYVDEEIMLREAYNKGLHQNDHRVRKRLLNLMRTSMTEIVPEPSIAQLRAYFDKNIETYSKPESKSYDIVFFDFASSNLPSDSIAFVSELNQSKDPIAYSEFFMIGNHFQKSTFKRIAIDHGRVLAEKLFYVDDNLWHGPVNVPKGLVYYRKVEDHDAEQGSFEVLESYLRTDYYLSKSRELQQEKIRELGKKYEIIISE